MTDNKTQLEIRELVQATESLEKWLEDNPSHPDMEKVQRQLNIKYVKLKARRDAERRAKNPSITQGLTEQHIPYKYQ